MVPMGNKKGADYGPLWKIFSLPLHPLSRTAREGTYYLGSHPDATPVTKNERTPNAKA